MNHIIVNTLSKYGTVHLEGDWRGYTVKLSNLPDLLDRDIDIWLLLLEDYGYKADIEFGDKTAEIEYVRKCRCPLFDFDEASRIWRRETGAGDPDRLKRQQEEYWARRTTRKRKPPKRYIYEC